MRRRSSLALVVPSLLVVVGVVPAGAEPKPKPLASDLLSPLSVAVAEDGSVWFSENYAGVLRHRGPGGRITTEAGTPGDLELSGVSEHDGTVSYVVTGAGHTIGRLRQLAPDGTNTLVADLYAHELRANPDHAFDYGFRQLPADCAAQLPRSGRASYRGKAETHPVATLPAHGAVYVADAAANAVTAVAGPDLATTVAALPPVAHDDDARVCRGQRLL